MGQGGHLVHALYRRCRVGSDYPLGTALDGHSHAGSRRFDIPQAKRTGFGDGPPGSDPSQQCCGPLDQWQFGEDRERLRFGDLRNLDVSRSVITFGNTFKEVRNFSELLC